MENTNINKDAVEKIDRIINRLKDLKSEFERRTDDEYFDDILMALVNNIFPLLSYLEAIFHPQEPGISKDELRKRLFEHWDWLYLYLSKKHFIFLSKEEKEIIKNYENDNNIYSFIKELVSELKSPETNMFLKLNSQDVERIASKVMRKNSKTRLYNQYL